MHLLGVMLPLILAGILVVWLAAIRVIVRIRSIPLLSKDPAPPGDDYAWPSLSIVVACRNEALSVESAMSSLLGQDYPRLDVVAVNDRSTDRTGPILDDLATRHPALRVVHVDALPVGWLGKNHALSRGAALATGDWILFTDADVVFARDALRRSMAWTLRERLGHGVALPHFVAPGFWERSFVALFGLLFHIRFRVYDLDKAKSAAYVGVGAFNLVRRADYQSIGGHDRLRLEIADDVKLGMLLRRSGVRQGCADSGGLVRVRWQPGFAATARGLVKNMFAGEEFRWVNTARDVLLLPLATTLPAVCLVLALSPTVKALAAAALLVPVVLQGSMARRAAGGHGHEGILLPFMGVVVAGVALASAIAATVRRGVVWRDTHYPLDQLRAGCVRESAWPTDRAPGR